MSNQKSKANNYDQAVKEMDAIEKGLSKKVPTEISEKERNMYHVLLISKTHVPHEERYDVRVSTQKLHQQAFEKASKGLQHQGFSKMIVVHSPEGGATSADPVQAQNAPDSTLNNAKQDGDVFAAIQKVVDELKRIYAEKWPNEEEPQQVITHDRISVIGKDKKELSRAMGSLDVVENVPVLAHNVDLSEMKGDDLKAFAKDNQIDYKSDLKVEELREHLVKWQDAAKKA